MLSYKGYTAEIKVDVDAEMIVGRVLDIKDTITFQGKTVEESLQEFHKSVDAYLMFCEELGQKPDKPFSGKLPFRTTPANHRAIYLAAVAAEKSINAWMEEALTRATAGLSPTALEDSHESSSVQYLLKERNVMELLEQVSPLLAQNNPRSNSHFITALEGLLVAMDKVRPFLTTQPPYDALTRLVSEIEVFLKKLPNPDEMYSPPKNRASMRDEG